MPMIVVPQGRVVNAFGARRPFLCPVDAENGATEANESNNAPEELLLTGR